MLHRLGSILALSLVLPLVSPLILHTPEREWHSGSWGNLISWTIEPGDESFSLYLVHQASNYTFKIGDLSLRLGNPVDAFLPEDVPPRPGYILRAVNVSDFNDVYATTGRFDVQSRLVATSSTGTIYSITDSLHPTTAATNTGTEPIPVATSTASDSSGTSSLNFNSGLVAVALAGFAGAAAVAL